MIIDFHTHVFPRFIRDDRSSLFDREPEFKTLYDSPDAKLVGVKDLIRSMDDDNVDMAVIFGFPWNTPEYYRQNNDYIIEAVSKYPDRLIGLCCFSVDALEAAEETERCLKAGLSGVGELAVYGSDLNTDIIRKLKGVMDVCLEYNALVLLHTNEPVGHKYAGKAPMTLGQIYRFLKTYPLNRIVLAHWGGGILFYGLMKKEVQDVFKNVWFDTAASPYLYKVDMYRIASEIIGYDKILFGTDYPLLKPKRYFKDMAKSGISSYVKDRICGLNAKALLDSVMK